MESRVLLSGFSSNSTTTTTTMQQPPSIKLQASAFGSHSLTQIDNFLSFRSQNSCSLKMSFNRMECVKSRGKVRCGVEDPIIRKKKLAVFVSGGGSNFKSIHEACVRGSILGNIVVLVTNRPDCGGAEYARSKEIPVILFPRTKDGPDGLSSSYVITALRSFQVDFILLAGYFKHIPAELIQAYPQLILNIHPSLLPAFGGKGYYGMKVHKAVIASGARYLGPTIHFVDEHYDTGCILAQRIVPVLADDTAEELAARVLQEEHRLYVEVTEALCEERIIWRKDGVPLIQSRENPDKYR